MYKDKSDYEDKTSEKESAKGLFSKADLDKPASMASADDSALDFYGIQKPAKYVEAVKGHDASHEEDEDEDEDGASEGQLTMDMGKSLEMPGKVEVNKPTLTAREALMLWADGE